MHHSGGANTETNMIYGEPAAMILEKVKDPHFMIVGLGLGYIEMNIAREALRLGKSVGLITSFEAMPELREFFFLWLHDRFEELHPEVSELYDQVLKYVLMGSGVSPKDLKEFLRGHFKNVAQIEGALDQEVVIKSRYHAIMYDAFSAKTSPHLWDEQFLGEFLKVSASEPSLFSTYSCRASLKRALKSQGFELTARPGFMGKPLSILALKSF
jgi:tRNA U34 5-methylaminomethyl-2-thiouridine-forming methyltransferase MnmC